MVHRFIGTAIALATTVVTANAQEQSEKPKVAGQMQFTKPLTIEDFKLEGILGSLLILFIVLWYSGSSANSAKAKHWIDTHIGYLEQQFALLGNRAEKKTLVKDGPSDYQLYVSGRRHVQFGHWWINLKPRSDILGWVFKLIASFVGFAEKPADQLNINMTLDKDLNKEFVFAILPKDTAQTTRDGRYDLKQFTRLADSRQLPSTLTVYTEVQKLSDQILSSKVSELIKNSPDFKSLIITSQPEFEPEKYKGDQELTFHLTADLSDRTEMVELACILPDIIKDINFSSDIKSKLKKNREELEKKAAKALAEERAEEIALKKAEAKRAEAEKVKTLSPAEQRKWEEKERARELKKSQKKRTKRA